MSKLNIDPVLLREAKRDGFSDKQIATIFGVSELEVRNYRKAQKIEAVFKTVDTCAAEFSAETPYHYSTYEEENESLRSNRKKVVILGGGPNRIGQGIEFDYCCVHAAIALREDGFETIMINCNPETVSTDYDTCDKLYFEPLTFEDVMDILDHEQPDGVIVTFGGQTPLKLAKQLEAAGVKILGTTPDMIDMAEDRKRFGELLDKLGIKCPPYGTASTVEDAVAVANRIGYPVLVRPSYVLGGRAMEICYREETVEEYMKNAKGVSPEHPVLIDRFLEDAYEFDVDAVRDAEGTVIIGGIMQHIEEAGIHSGDSSSVIPPYYISEENYKQIVEYTRQLATNLEVVGLINVQYALKDKTVYVLEVNPRASRTVPFVSKATGQPLAKIAARVMAGASLKAIGARDFDRDLPYVSIKESVFPFDKFPKVKMFLGPEMRSTGEVMGIGKDFGEAILKSHRGAGLRIPTEGTIFVSLRDFDKKPRTAQVIRDFHELGFKIIATEGTQKYLEANDIPANRINKVSEGRPNIVDAIKNGEVQIVINTPSGEISRIAEYQIGWAAVEHKVPFITTLSAAASVVSAVSSLRRHEYPVRSIQELHKMLAANN
ncbi:MAG TPA: carbamoyl-phosphate synthase large subunit [Candidatus Kapabacteria bacterium]|nr:carbamoyl-phosphate synthase large subunit [Candidatus Kapabacteria bacterium]